MKKLIKFTVLLSILTAFVSLNAACKTEPKTEPEYVSVTFLLDGGKIHDKDISKLEVEKGTNLELGKYQPEKSDFNFSGWLMNATKYAENDVIVVNSDITLKALWESVKKEKFTVIFDCDGGILNGSSDKEVEVEKNDVIDFSDYIPERTGYIFKGWKSGETLYDGGEYTVVADIRFTAVWAKAPSSDANFIFEATADGEGYILKDLAEELETTDLVLPGYYDGKPVIRIANNAFSYNDKITGVDLSDCEKLEEIGDWNFYDCPALVSINFEGCESLEKIGGACFNELPSTKEINLKGLRSLREIGSQSFRGKEQMPLNVAELDFSDCVSLQSIGQMSFWHINVKELDFSQTQIETFERQTIHHSIALETLKLPKTLKLTQDSSEFCSRCENLSEIIVDPMNIYMTIDNNALMDVDKTVIFKYAVKSDAKAYKAPESVKTVMSCAFYKAKNLTEIDFTSARITQIGYSAFDGCVNAVLKVPFGEDGSYEDGSQSCELGAKWNVEVSDTRYGEPAKSFFFETDLKDGISVSESELSFTASAKYGPSFKLEKCDLTVKVNDSEITGDDGNYAAHLSDGENIIALIASYADKSETKIYKIYKTAQAELKTDLTEGTASGIMNFKLWAEVAGERQDLSDKTLNVLFAWESSGYSGFNSVIGDYVRIDYNAEEKCFDVSIDIDSINMIYFDSGCKIKFEIDGYTADPIILSFTLEW